MRPTSIEFALSEPTKTRQLSKQFQCHGPPSGNRMTIGFGHASFARKPSRPIRILKFESAADFPDIRHGGFKILTPPRSLCARLRSSGSEAWRAKSGRKVEAIQPGYRTTGLVKIQILSYSGPDRT